MLPLQERNGSEMWRQDCKEPYLLPGGHWPEARNRTPKVVFLECEQKLKGRYLYVSHDKDNVMEVGPAYGKRRKNKLRQCNGE